MRLVASFQSFLLTLLALFSRCAPAFVGSCGAIAAARPTSRQRLERPPRLAGRLIETLIFPADYFYGPYAIGPPRRER
jgi:hypothetical protein